MIARGELSDMAAFTCHLFRKRDLWFESRWIRAGTYSVIPESLRQKCTEAVRQQKYDCAYIYSTMKVHIIYSDGGEIAQEHLWKFYSVALIPFTLCIPAGDVTLFLNDVFVRLDEDLWHLIENIPASEGLHSLLPQGYKAYFWSVYRNAVGMNRFLTNHEKYDRPILKLPTDVEYDLLYITGYGFSEFEKGAQLRFTSTPLSFPDIGSLPKLLTILDVCQSPAAVAIFSKTYPKDPTEFKWKAVFKNPERLVPVVCDKCNGTWAFRVGYDGQPPDDSDESHLTQMTVPYGDSVACSMLLAIKSFVDDNFQGGSLDNRFAAAYRNLRTGFLPRGTNTPKPYSNLGSLQAMIARGELSVNMAAFSCHLFRKRDLWFVTAERATVLAKTDDKLATKLIAFVVEQVKTWHEANPESIAEKDGSRKAWEVLIKTLGPFRSLLKSIELSRGKDMKISENEDGLQFEIWAIGCSELTQIVQRVHAWISTGSPNYDEVD